MGYRPRTARGLKFYFSVYALNPGLRGFSEDFGVTVH